MRNASTNVYISHTHTYTHTYTDAHHHPSSSIIIHPPDRGGAGSSEGAQRELGLSGKYCRPKFSFFEGRRLANFAEGSHDDANLNQAAALCRQNLGFSNVGRGWARRVGGIGVSRKQKCCVHQLLFAPTANFYRPRALSPPTDMRRGRASGCRGLWPRLEFRWALASSRVPMVASGAAGSSPASSHLRPWGPPDRRTGDATRTANSRRLAASPKRLYTIPKTP